MIPRVLIHIFMLYINCIVLNIFYSYAVCVIAKLDISESLKSLYVYYNSNTIIGYPRD